MPLLFLGVFAASAEAAPRKSLPDYDELATKRAERTKEMNDSPEQQQDVDCVIVGAGVAGTVAGMHDPRCFIIDGSPPAAFRKAQGIQQGLGAMLQKWNDVKFPVPPRFGHLIAQPHEFVEESSYVTKPGVTLDALEAARATNELAFGLKVVHGTVKDITFVPGSDRSLDRVTLVVTPAVPTETERKEITLTARYVIVATGAGTNPNRPDYWETYRTLLDGKTEGGIARGLADVELMGGDHGGEWSETAKSETWLVSGLNPGSLSVVAFLLEKGVPPANITVFGTDDDKPGLAGLRVFDAYDAFFDALDSGKITLTGKKLDRAVTLADEGGKLALKNGTSSNSRTFVADHFVTAINMQSSLPGLFADGQIDKKGSLDPLLVPKVWSWDGVIGVRLHEKDSGNMVPIAVLGAAITTWPRSLPAPDLSTLNTPKTGLIAGETQSKPEVFTPAAIPYMAPKIAAGTLLLFFGR